MTRTIILLLIEWVSFLIEYFIFVMAIVYMAAFDQTKDIVRFHQAVLFFLMVIAMKQIRRK